MLFAVLLILIGGLLLLVDLGLVGAEVWWALLRLWPVALIAIGLDLVVGRRSTAARIGVAAVSLLVVAAGLTVLLAGEGPAAPERTTVAHEHAGTERADITLEPGVGRLDLTTTGDEDVLLVGAVTAPSGGTIVDERVDTDGSTEIRVALEGRRWSPFGVRGSRDVPTWELSLGRAAPVTLTVTGGVGTSRLDLRDARVEGLSVETGVGALEIAGPWEDDGGGTLRSTDWDTAADRVDLSVRAGVGRVQIRETDRP